MNSFIFTGDGGVSMIISGKPYTIQKTHPNYALVIAALRTETFAAIPELVSMAKVVEKYVEKTDYVSETIKIDTVAGAITYKGRELHNTLVARILAMLAQGFKVTPMIKYLENLMQNPSKTAVDELYSWHEVAGMPITEDGHFLAYKRVREDFGSFYDSGKTMNVPGTTISMDRNEVDDNRNNTCSYGFHFCSQSYLPNYCGGQGQVLVLKINPKDVVSIPSDYGNAKGRACSYEILYALKDGLREQVEESNPLTAPVQATEPAKEAEVRNDEPSQFDMGYQCGKEDALAGGRRVFIPGISDYGDGYVQGYAEATATAKVAAELNAETSHSSRYKAGYISGHSDGRQKLVPSVAQVSGDDYSAGYYHGYKDGKGKKGRLYK